MPILADFPFTVGTDATITLALEPPAGVSGFTIQFQAGPRFGWTSGLINKYTSSGLNNVSGINVTDYTNGVMKITLNGVDTSGMDPSNLAYKVWRTDSGNVDTYAQGYIILQPN